MLLMPNSARNISFTAETEIYQSSFWLHWGCTVVSDERIETHYGLRAVLPIGLLLAHLLHVLNIWILRCFSAYPGLWWVVLWIAIALLSARTSLAILLWTPAELPLTRCFLQTLVTVLYDKPMKSAISAILKPTYLAPPTAMPWSRSPRHDSFPILMFDVNIVFDLYLHNLLLSHDCLFSLIAWISRCS